MQELQFNIWDAGEHVIGIASNRFGSGHFILSACHNEAAYTLEMVLDATDARAGMFQNGHMIGFVGMDGLYQLFTICESEITATNASTLSVYAEHALYELAQEPVLSLEGEASLAYALTQALQNTRWSLDYCVDAGSQPLRRANTDALACLKAAAEAYDVELAYNVTVTDNTIVSRHVRAVARLGANRGRRFEYTKDTNTIKGNLSISNVKTALIGLGKGSQANSEERMTFASIAWSTANGNPANKPMGAVFVEDASAKSAYGLAGGTRNRVGYVTFSDITDPEALLQATWEALQEQKQPTASYTLSVMDLEKSEGPQEAVRIGDTVNVIHRKISPPILLTARVSNVKRDLLSPENTGIQLGDATSAISATLTKTAALAERAKAINGNGTLPADYLQGAIDALANQLIASGAYAQANVIEGKGLLFENTEPLSPGFGALYLGPGIFAIANTRTGGAWNWRTFGTGAGFDADAVTTGTLNAALIRILGNDNFFWDAANIYAIDPSDNNKQTRFGHYDGVHYGLAQTLDGGATWVNKLDFDGASFSYAFKVLNALGEVLMSVTQANDAAGEAEGILKIGKVLLDTSIILQPINGGTGYASGQTHRVTAPPDDSLGSDGDLAVFYNGSTGAYATTAPTIGASETATRFGENRIWNNAPLNGYAGAGNTGVNRYGSYWSFVTPDVDLTTLSLQCTAGKHTGGAWYGWSTRLPLTVAVYASLASTTPLATATFVPANDMQTASVSLAFSAALAKETTYYMAIYDPSEALNKSRAIMQRSSVEIPGSDGGASFALYVKDNGAYRLVTASVSANLTAHAEDENNPHKVTAAQVSAVPTSRKVNGKALNGDITLNAADVSAATSTHAHGGLSSDGKMGTNAGQFLMTGENGAVTLGSPGIVRTAIDAQQTIAYGATAPANPFAGQIWLKPKV